MCVASAHADVEFHELELDEERTLRYAVLLPDRFDEQLTYPALLALPPGRQDERMVMAGFNRYWGEQAAEAGWVVISPIAPDGVLFFEGSEDVIPALLDEVESVVHVEHGRFHLAGASNGGRSAFRVATLYPERFASLTVLPGYPPDPSDEGRLGRLARMPVQMFVGENDGHWVEAAKKTQASLRAIDVAAELTVLEGEGHVPESLDGKIVPLLETLRRQPIADRNASAEVGAVIDALHDAAALADGKTYFELFAPGAVFIGTAPEERWTIAQFRAYAEPYFDAGTGWTYVPTERNVYVDPHGHVAWFDERLDNAKYGECRGTGVVVRIGERWLIAQYSLSLPLPNEITGDVVEMIRGRG